MNKLIALLFVITVTIGMSILVMIYGWGLEPKSWWWIIGVGIFGQMFMKLIGDKVLESK
ncbi:MAG: hypothetical protein GY845_03275 [Planctomycetes bacterium]|nr:hypothetical protein [Planctomycetota bacterium]